VNERANESKYTFACVCEIWYIYHFAIDEQLAVTYTLELSVLNSLIQNVKHVSNN
jgi:hypothetical protein